MNKLPKTNWGIVTNNTKESSQIGLFIRKHYSHINSNMGWNASDYRIYGFAEDSSRIECWTIKPSNIKLFTLDEMKALLSDTVPEVINTYEIY